MPSAEFIARAVTVVRRREAATIEQAHADAVRRTALDLAVDADTLESWMTKPTGIDLLDPLVHLADGSGHMPACGATFVAHAGESNVTEHLIDVTCTECKAIGEERGWERDEERRLQYAGEAARDRAVDAQIEASRLGDA